MRKLFTVILGISILACLSIFAERTMYVKHKTAGVMSFKVSAKDSLYFWNTVADKDADESELMMYVRTANNGLKSIPYKQVDSIYFSKTESSVVDEKDYKKDGALIKAAFKVSDTKSVYFSQGNLQFNAMQGTHKTSDGEEAQGTWRFAENQYDIIGKSYSGDIDSTYNGWIDLFYWGTSGWKSGAECYQPWSFSSYSSDYYSGGSQSNDLIGKYANADWGVYNAISNGGNEPEQWRTLTSKEWEYLCSKNQCTWGYIYGVGACLMLIPETFTAPEGITVEVVDIQEGVKNRYTKEQFALLEKHGVVVLPVGSSGYYWSSSSNGVGYYGSYAQVFQCSTTSKYSTTSIYVGIWAIRRNDGCGVRLVQDVSE